MRVIPKMIISVVRIRITAFAAAAGNCRYCISTLMILPTEAICCPPITPMVMKSPMTMVTTKIEPMMIPGRHSGITTLNSICQVDAPAS